MMLLRSATEPDWPSVWSIIRQVAAAGNTYSLEPDVSEAAAKEYWMGPGLSAYVAEDAGEIVGTYTLKANQRGLGSHVANAGYMVRPDSMVAASAAGLPSTAWRKREPPDFKPCSSTPL
jgi:hypothetical protein